MVTTKSLISLLMIHVLLGLILYFYDIQPRLIDLYKYQAEFTWLSSKIKSFKQINQEKISKKITLNTAQDEQQLVEWMSTLLLLINNYQLTLQLMEVQSKWEFKFYKTPRVAIKISGQASQIDLFIHTLLRLSQWYWMKYVLLQAQEDKINANIQLVMLKAQQSLSKQLLFISRQSKNDTKGAIKHFCSKSRTYFTQPNADSNQQSQYFSWRDMKLIGDISSFGKHQGLLSLPNGKLIIAKPNMILGKENGLITLIQKNRIEINIKGDHQIIEG